MPSVKSLDDLKKIREDALKKQQLKETSGKTEVIVGMGTVGIAAGARETLKAILDIIEKDNLSDIIIRQTGNIGLDSYEPIVQVILPGEEKVSYGKVNPEMARRIMKEHVLGGEIVKDFQIEG
ncbi:MAG: (2Fe-2S) ferredoxin domain-containing protein [Brevefilum sp.]|nr:(2Fe-2S) ferredoxin domain-containing protein [Brevefilum sp.]MDT8381097.1 (2Fe-2S) ferredoxin domain-containing protein [Brevefilum sp.]MDW7754201.1 (2Fe-2S) ferredoxin domain-containing protein [Brevefilum sp.]